ncbi:MAG TPA: DUF6174 domain-containing protein [Candidatus Kryptonia bacterium]
MKGICVTVILAVTSFACSKDATVNVKPGYDYSIDQTRLCFCPGSGDSARIYVVADTIFGAISLSDNTPLTISQRTRFRTIKGLLDEMARCDTSIFNIEVRYDSVYGFPAWLSIYPKLSSGLYDASLAYSTHNYAKYK